MNFRKVTYVWVVVFHVRNDRVPQIFVGNWFVTLFDETGSSLRVLVPNFYFNVSRDR